MARFLEKMHAGPDHRGVICGEIVRMEKQRNPAAGLIADAGGLRRVIGPCKQDFCPVFFRRHDNLALGRGQGGVADQGKAEYPSVPGNRLVVIAHDERDYADVAAYAAGPSGGGGGALEPRFTLRRIMPKLAPPVAKANAK